MRAAAPQAPIFFFDVAVPEAYLSAERILALMPVPCAWQPVLARKLPGGHPTDIDRAAIEQTAAARGLQPMRWPDPLPFDSELAMRAAVYARSGGKTVSFSLAAFRQAYAGGRALSETDNILIAGAAAELHPRALLKALQLRSTISGLQHLTDQAITLGVTQVPAIWTGTEIFTGDAALDAACRALGPA